jgi:hypothetical protein
VHRSIIISRQIVRWVRIDLDVYRAYRRLRLATVNVLHNVGQENSSRAVYYFFALALFAQKCTRKDERHLAPAEQNEMSTNVPLS